MVMRGVMEEKVSRIAEVIVSSVKPFQLMMGKITGIGAVGLVQFIIWIILMGGIRLLVLMFFPSLLGATEGMEDMKTVVDSLALNIEKFFGREEQKADFEASMQDILELSGGAYSSVKEIMAQVQSNKAQNYTPRKYISRR